jgi:hypothetical protein
MTVHLEEVQLRRRGMIRKTQKAIRAHYAELADRELNEVLPAIEAEYDALVNDELVLPGDVDIADIVNRAVRKARAAIKELDA